ncbi:MAG: PHP domain-containing protein, partial [Thermoanaerobaculia bacterium]
MRIIVAVIAALVCIDVHAAWLKGNLHTHTSESDGDSTPAEIVRWYEEHGYDFLVITDHDKITKAEGKIVLIPGEEVTASLNKKSLHVNAIGLREVVKPIRGATKVETLQKNIDAVRAAGGIAAINHPNFGWAFGAEELLQLENATLLEIASGHPYVNTEGPPSVEAMWTQMLDAGKRIWAMAVDDVHHL